MAVEHEDEGYGLALGVFLQGEHPHHVKPLGNEPELVICADMVGQLCPFGLGEIRWKMVHHLA